MKVFGRAKLFWLPFRPSILKFLGWVRMPTINYSNEIIIYSRVMIAQLYTVSISDKINKSISSAVVSIRSGLLFALMVEVESAKSVCSSETVVTNFYYIINELRGQTFRKQRDVLFRNLSPVNHVWCICYMLCEGGAFCVTAKLSKLSTRTRPSCQWIR